MGLCMQVAPFSIVVNVAPTLAVQCIGNKVSRSQRKQNESAQSSDSEVERENLSLPVKRARRDYSKPKYFERLMAGE